MALDVQRALTNHPRQAHNASVSTPAAGFAADAYLVGSAIAVPNGLLKATSKYKCRFSVSKTAAGVATPILTVRFGTAGSVADAARCTLTFALQTAVVDEGLFEVEVIFRVVGAAAVMQAVGVLLHRLSVTGLSTDVTGMKLSTSAAFDSTVANSIIGLSVNGGTAAAWTVAVVSAELVNLN